MGRRASQFFEGLFSDRELENDPPRGWKTKYSQIILVCSLVLSILCILYPFVLADRLAEDVSWSWDLGNYMRMLQRIEEQKSPYAFFIFKDRAISLFSIYTVWKAVGSSAWTGLKLSPFLLAPLLPLATYFFCRQNTEDAFFPSLAFLFTVFSFHITVGFGVAFLSNWMALIILYLFSGLLLKSLQQESWIWVGHATTALILLLFTHAYTWGMLMGVLAIFTTILGIRWLQTKGSIFDLKALGVLMAISLSADLIKNLILSSTLAMGEETAHVGQLGLALKNLNQFLSTIHFTFHGWTGFYNNPALIFLAFVGSFVLLHKTRRFQLYLLSFLVASSIPFIFGNHTIQIRIIYNLPLQILALMGLLFITKQVQKYAEPLEGKILSITLVLLFVLINVNYVLRCAIYIAGHMNPV